MSRIESNDASAQDPPELSFDPLVGVLVAGTYRLVRLIGSGGAGQVYEAEHVRLGRLVAVKLLRKEFIDRAETKLRFRREARLVATLENDHVVDVLDCGELSDGTLYLAMERLRGEDLRSRLATGRPLPVRQALVIALHACRGLEAVHEAGIVHRDLKPANLFLVEQRGGAVRCKILDFGVAKALSTSDTTRQGVVLGTIRYMAPEQVLRDTAVDVRTDLYAVGAVLYECLTGVTAHDGETAEEVMFSIVNRIPAPPYVLRPEVGQAVSELTLRCLSRRPEARFQSARDLAQRLAQLLAAMEPLEQETPPPLEETLLDRTDETDRPGTPRTGTHPSATPRRSLVLLVVGCALGLAVGVFAKPEVALKAASQKPRAAATAAAQVAPTPGSPASIPLPIAPVLHPAPKLEPPPRAGSRKASALQSPGAGGALRFDQFLEVDSPYATKRKEDER